MADRYNIITNRIAWTCDCHNEYQLTFIGFATVDGLSASPPVKQNIEGKSMYVVAHKLLSMKQLRLHTFRVRELPTRTSTVSGLLSLCELCGSLGKNKSHIRFINHTIQVTSTHYAGTYIYRHDL